MVARSRSIRLAAFALAAASLAPPAHATGTLRIEQVYSNLDGTIQYLQLRDTSPAAGPRDLGGIVITSIRNGVARSIPIAKGTVIEGGPGVPFMVSTFQMPSVCCTGPYEPLPVYRSPVAGGTRVFGPDSRILPVRFLPLRNGTVSLSDGDTVSYVALPTAGHLAIDHAGVVVRAHALPYLLHTMPIPSVPRLTEVVPTEVLLREYRSIATGRHLRTADADEIHALDTQRVPGWVRVPHTGFRVASHAGAIDYALVAPQTVTLDGAPACRYALPPPNASHFLSASAEECAAVPAAVPGAVLETSAAFHAQLPDPASGACDDVPWPHPVYRLFDARGGTGHRYVAAPSLHDELLEAGWLPDGFGPDGTAFCVSAFEDPDDAIVYYAVPPPGNPAAPRMPIRGR